VLVKDMKGASEQLESSESFVAQRFTTYWLSNHRPYAGWCRVKASAKRMGFV